MMPGIQLRRTPKASMRSTMRRREHGGVHSTISLISKMDFSLRFWHFRSLVRLHISSSCQPFIRYLLLAGYVLTFWLPASQPSSQISCAFLHLLLFQFLCAMDFSGFLLVSSSLISAWYGSYCDINLCLSSILSCCHIGIIISVWRKDSQFPNVMHKVSFHKIFPHSDSKNFAILPRIYRSLRAVVFFSYFSIAFHSTTALVTLLFANAFAFEWMSIWVSVWLSVFCHQSKWLSVLVQHRNDFLAKRAICLFYIF